jgi:NADH dehydrogenase/NADH:ubiquinone oxidoreductase subunit G
MKIKLNNNEINANEGEKIIEIAKRNGIEIPALCYVPGFKHQSSCMVCVVKKSDTGEILPSCSTIVTDGMNIDTESEDVKNFRKQSLELLLSDHMAVCRPPCDKDKCRLRKVATEYRAKWTKYPRYSAIKDTPPQHIKDNFWFDVTKCIRCGLCVHNSNDGFTYKGRGFEMQIVLPTESVGNVDEKLCELCPTQALYKTEA